MSFGKAIGHRLRQVREADGATAADIAAGASRYLGLGWDRSTVARIELGQRQLTAAELLVLPALYGRPVAELLPTEPCRLTEVVGANPDLLRKVLTGVPRGYDLPKVRQDMTTVLDKVRRATGNARARYPRVELLLVSEAAGHAGDDTTVKAARRLEADPWDVAVAAQSLWDRDLASERDERVGKRAGESMRSRQARRGHVTRQLLDQLRPVVQELQAARSEEGDVDGQR